MSTVLEYMDDTTRNVVSLIVSKYKEDCSNLKYFPTKQVDGIGISFIELIETLTGCKILRDGTYFGIKLHFEDCLKFEDISLQVAHHGNNGFLIQTKALQIINFLFQLYKEGLIILPEFALSKMYRIYKGSTFDKNKDMFYPIKNNEINVFISKAYYSHLCPTLTLINFSDKFETAEQKRFSKNVKLGYSGIIAALIIALGSPWLMTKFSKTTIEDRQFNDIIYAIQTDTLNTEYKKIK